MKLISKFIISTYLWYKIWYRRAAQLVEEAILPIWETWSLRGSWRKIEKRAFTQKQVLLTGGSLQPCNWTKQAVWPAVFSRDNRPARSGKVLQQCPVVRKEGPSLHRTKRQSSSEFSVEGSALCSPGGWFTAPRTQPSYWWQVGVWRMSSPSRLLHTPTLNHLFFAALRQTQTHRRGPMLGTQCATARWEGSWRHWRHYRSAESKHRRLLCLRGAWPAHITVSCGSVWNGSAMAGGVRGGAHHCCNNMSSQRSFLIDEVFMSS